MKDQVKHKITPQAGTVEEMVLVPTGVALRCLIRNAGPAVDQGKYNWTAPQSYSLKYCAGNILGQNLSSDFTDTGGSSRNIPEDNSWDVWIIRS